MKQGKDYTVSYYRSVQSRYDYDLGRYVYEMSGPVSSKKGEMLTDEDFMTDGHPRDRVTVYAVFRGKGNFASDDPDLINYSAYQVRRQPETGRYLDMSKATVTITRKNEAGKTVKVTFIKADGTERVMVAKRDKEAEAKLSNAGRNLNREDMLRVTEFTADGTTQWRTIPFARLINVEVL